MHKRKLAKYTKLELKICVFCILTVAVEYGKMADRGWAPRPVKSQYTDVTKFYFQICIFCILHFYPKTDILNLSKEREEMSMRKVKYVLSNGVITESYKVAKSYDVPFRVTLETVPETPIRLSEKRKAIRKVVK